MVVLCAFLIIISMASYPFEIMRFRHDYREYNLRNISQIVFSPLIWLGFLALVIGAIIFLIVKKIICL